MRFAILGPLTITDGSRPVAIRGLMPRSLLSVLLLRADTAVSADHLIATLWGTAAPASAMASLHNHVMRLRRMLGDEAGARIETGSAGYLIRIRPGELDLHEFTALCTEGLAAQRAGDWAAAAAALADALALWRGDPIGGVPGLAGQEAQLQQLAEARWQAWEGRIEADLHLGRHEEVTGELRALIAEHPRREAFHGQLMLALYRSGRQVEALEVFRALRRTLVEELGVEPSAPLRQIHLGILNGGPVPAQSAPDGTYAPSPAEPASGSLAGLTPASAMNALNALSADGTARPNNVFDARPGDAPSAVPVAPAPHAARPGSRYQLPADSRSFTGRRAEIDHLISLLSSLPGGAPDTGTSTSTGTVVISAIDGMGGIGKTALALHAAHRVRDAFPDGQLFIDLLGHAAHVPPLATGDALGWLLRSLGVPTALIPRDLGERAALYRDRLDGTRTLVILDNAADTAQVRPLLPGTPGCQVLVTSRRRLIGLDDAHPLALDVLTEAEAAALLHKAAGDGRIPQEHPSIPELLAICGHLPLAVRLAAVRLRRRAGLGVEDLVADLREESTRLSRLQDEDRDLTAVFDSSYVALSDAQQQLFRCLGTVSGPDVEVDVAAAAGLLGTDPHTAERLLDSLLDHNLLIQRDPGRYRLHELTRVYARSLSAGPGHDKTGAGADG